MVNRGSPARCWACEFLVWHHFSVPGAHAAPHKTSESFDYCAIVPSRQLRLGRASGVFCTSSFAATDCRFSLFDHPPRKTNEQDALRCCCRRPGPVGLWRAKARSRPGARPRSGCCPRSGPGARRRCREARRAGEGCRCPGRRACCWRCSCCRSGRPGRGTGEGCPQEVSQAPERKKADPGSAFLSGNAVSRAPSNPATAGACAALIDQSGAPMRRATSR